MKSAAEHLARRLQEATVRATGGKAKPFDEVEPAARDLLVRACDELLRMPAPEANTVVFPAAHTRTAELVLLEALDAHRAGEFEEVVVIGVPVLDAEQGEDDRGVLVEWSWEELGDVALSRDVLSEAIEVTRKGED